MLPVKKFLACLLLAVPFVFAAPAYAGKTPAPGLISVNQTGIHYGDTVTFTATFESKLNSGNNHIYVYVYCGGVTQPHGGLIERMTSQGLLLDWWDGTETDCTADLRAYRYSNGSLTTIGSTTFHVS